MRSSGVLSMIQARAKEDLPVSEEAVCSFERVRGVTMERSCRSRPIRVDLPWSTWPVVWVGGSEVRVGFEVVVGLAAGRGGFVGVGVRTDHDKVGRILCGNLAYSAATSMCLFLGV